MRHPYWILNSSLAILVITAFLFVLFFRQTVPSREPIDVDFSQGITKQDQLKININKIYENDIFDTYKKPTADLVQAVKEIPLPLPPQPVTPKIPEAPKIEFLDPLNITLKGILVVSQDEQKNRAVIQDNETTRETVYKVGNMILDAQLIKIFTNKVVFLRSNGQQEVLYLREKDAATDPVYASLSNWSKIIKHVDDFYHVINPITFSERIQNISQFIDALDLTTAYNKGQSIGCRVGNVKKDSLGAALGLRSGDIITAAENIPALDTQHRFQIYKKIIAKKLHEPIIVKVLRNQIPVNLVYVMEEFDSADRSELLSPAQDLQEKQILQEKQLKALQERPKLLSSAQDVKKRERKNMLAQGKKPAQTGLVE